MLAKNFITHLRVDVDVVKSRESFGVPNESIRAIDAEEVIYSGDRLWEKVVSSDISLMDNYLKSYEEFQRLP